MPLSKIILSLLLLLCGKVVFAFEPVILEEPVEEQYLGTNLYILEEAKNLSIAEISNQNSKLNWRKNQTDSLNLGFTSNIIWVRIALENKTEVNMQYLLEVDYPRIDYLDFYHQAEEGLKKLSAGSLDNFHSREIKYRNPVFKINLPKNETHQYFFRIETQTALQLPLILYSETKFQEKLNKEQLLHGIHFGILILSALYGILLFRLMNDWSNLFFSLYSFSILLVFLIMTGIGFQYLWKNEPRINHLNSFAILASAGLGLQFSRSTLNIEKYSKFANRVFNWLTVINLTLFFVIFFIPYSIGAKISMFMTILTAILIVIIGFAGSLKNSKPGIYIFTASLFGLSEWSIRILHYFGSINFAISFTDTILIRCLERIILCLALIAKVKEIKEENEANQIKRLEDEIKTQEKLTHLNAEMEIQVVERTKDLEKEKEIAIKANRLKDSFITTVSHDLKSPILNTRNLLSILIQKEEMDWEERLYYLQNCHSALTSSYQMVYNILNLDRFESGNIEIIHEYVDLHSILKKVILELEYSYTLKKISIELAANEDLIVIGDSQLLFQLFLNLVSNAIKFSYENSKINIVVSKINNFFQIEIQDYGIGISEVDKNKLLSNVSFSRQGTYGEPGTGFGIGIIKQILLLHDGYFEIESEKEKGTNFKIKLPCHEKLAICFSEEEFFYQLLKDKSQEFEIRILKIYEFENLLSSIRNLNPDYLLFGLQSLKGINFQELIRISHEENINSIPAFIQIYSDINRNLSELKFLRLVLNDKMGTINSSLKDFFEN